MRAGLVWSLKWVFTSAIIFIAGCAINTGAKGPIGTQNSGWQGRLSLKVHSTPVQVFSADFDLRGNAQTGSLRFTSPLGNTLAQLQWDADTAALQTTGEPQRFSSLQALVRHTTGTDLPVTHLFDWLQGVSSEAPGWQADLRELPVGRISAQRLAPETPAELRIILDR